MLRWVRWRASAPERRELLAGPSGTGLPHSQAGAQAPAEPHARCDATRSGATPHPAPTPAGLPRMCRFRRLGLGAKVTAAAAVQAAVVCRSSEIVWTGPYLPRGKHVAQGQAKRPGKSLIKETYGGGAGSRGCNGRGAAAWRGVAGGASMAAAAVLGGGLQEMVSNQWRSSSPVKITLPLAHIQQTSSSHSQSRLSPLARGRTSFITQARPRHQLLSNPQPGLYVRRPA